MCVCNVCVCVCVCVCVSVCPCVCAVCCAVAVCVRVCCCRGEVGMAIHSFLMIFIVPHESQVLTTATIG